MESKKTFGGFVKAKRTEIGLTQKEFSDMLYVTESAVSKWERGLSYPDITLISDICRILNISERELLTASEDIRARNQERLAKRYLALVSRFKMVQYVLYGISLLTCFIVNLATSGKLSWFFIVLTAEIVAASLTLLPVFYEKKRGLITLSGFTVSLTTLLAVCCIYVSGDWFFITFISVVFGLSVLFMPFVIRTIWLPSPNNGYKAVICLAADTILLYLLLFAANTYGNGGWFLTVACPIAAFWLILPWGYTLVIRYAKINSFFKAAACSGLTGMVFYLMRGFMDMILGEPYRFGLQGFSFSNMQSINAIIDAIIFFALLALTVLFAAMGIIRENKNRKNEDCA